MPTAQRSNLLLKPAIILPAASAYDAGSVFAIDQGTEVTFYFTYTRGGAAGAFQYKIDFSIDGTNYFQQSTIQDQLIVVGADTVARSQRVSVLCTATGAAAESFCSDTFTCPSNWVRISARETGNAGAPGTLAIQAFLMIPL